MNGYENNHWGSYPERFQWKGELRYKYYHHRNEMPFKASLICNLGRSGVCFLADETVIENSIIILKLYRHNDYSPIKILAKVKRCDKIQGSRGYEVDCVFHELNAQEKAMIHELIEEICFILRIQTTVKNSFHDEKIKPKAKTKRTKKQRRS